MNLLSRVLIFSMLVFIGDFKSVDLNPSIQTQSEVADENILKKVDTKISQKEMELKELKKNIGKVGNKLEGIVYEVLKDFLDKDFESGESENSVNSRKINEEKDSVTENLLKKYHPAYYGNENLGTSVIDDEVIHSARVPTLHENKSLPNSNESFSTESVLEYTIDLPEESKFEKMNNISETTTASMALIQSNKSEIDQTMNEINTAHSHIQSPMFEFQHINEQNSNQFNKAENTDTSKITKSIPNVEAVPGKVKIRRRRMIQGNPEQIQSVENFVEPNSEHMNERIPKFRRRFEGNRPEEPSILGIINAPEEEIRISHRRSESKSQTRNEGRRENLINISKEGHKKRKISSEDRQIEKVPDISRNMRIFSPDDQISDNSEVPKTQKITPESDDMKMMRLSAANNSDGLDDTRLGQSFGWGNQATSPCNEKNEREEFLEKQHIEDLKYEVGKLRSVVDLLREQQKLLNTMDYSGKKDPKQHEMLTVLNQLNGKDKSINVNDRTQTNEIDLVNKARHEELEHIKIQVKDAIDNLNRTREILNLEHKKELKLEEELKSQKTEINWLKLIMENFIIAQSNREKENQNLNLIEYQSFKENKTDSPILRASIPPMLKNSSVNRTQLVPVSTVKMAEKKIRELEQKKTQTLINRESDTNFNILRSRTPKVRANEFSTIGKLLDMVNDKQPKSDEDDIQMKILEVVSELRRKKEKENSLNDVLRKLQAQIKGRGDDDDLSQLLNIQKGLKNLDAPSSKIDDLDVEDQLKLLQREINKLKPNDELSFLSTEGKAPPNNAEQIQAMLTKLIAANPQFQNTKFPPITPQQLMQLQKKINAGNGIATAGIGNIGGDIGISSPAGFINPLSAAIGKMGPYYAPYGNTLGPSPISAYQTLYGGLGNTGYGSLGLGGNGYSGRNGYLAGYPGASFPPFVPKSTYSTSYAPSYIPVSYKPSYAKIQDGINPYSAQSSYPNPYGLKADQYNSEKSIYGANNFFQLPNFYGGSPPSSYFPPKSFDSEGFDKINSNQFPYSGSPAPVAADKLNDLKNQIYGLQTAINSYNRPEYTQTPEDRTTIQSLEQQIDELKGIVGSLNGYSADQLSYLPPGGSYDSVGYSSPDAQSGSDAYNNRASASENRSKRSIDYVDSINKNMKMSKENSKKINRENHYPEKNTDGRKDTGLYQKLMSITGTDYISDNVNLKTRKRRSIDDNTVEERQTSGVLEKLTSALRDVLDKESETPSPSISFQSSPLHLLRRPSTQVRNPPNEIPHHNPELVKHSTLQNIKQQIDHLKNQLGHHKSDDNVAEINKSVGPQTFNQISPFSTRHALLPEPPYNNYNYNNYGNMGLAQFPSDLTVKPKKLDIFKSIVAKIMDKVIESLPVILHKLFGFAVHELTSYGDYGAYNNGGYGSDSGVFKTFKNLGVFGYIPLIILRLVNAVSTFIYVLQKNKFLKYFLVPAGVVLLVGGSMVFLIWWLQPSDYYLNYESPHNKYSYDKGYSNGYDYQNDYGKSSGKIVKSYNADEENHRLNTYKSTPEVKAIPYSPNNILYPSFYKTPQISIASDYMMPSYGE